MQDRKFPIGPFVVQESYTEGELKQLIKTIETAPAHYRSLVRNLSESDLEKTYREGSWTIRQLVHHVADIHLLHFFRMKKALTEADYKEVTLINMDGWAKTPDAATAPISDSLEMFDFIGKRYVYLANNLTEEQFSLSYFHPLRQFWIDQKQALAMSAWHVSHHLAHIKLALE